MRRLIAAPTADCPQWSVAIVNDSTSRGAPPSAWAAFGDGPTPAAARIAAIVAAEERKE